MADPDVGMDKAELKKLLARSKKEPVNCAVGLTKDGVVLLLDKIKQPKALVKDLEKKFSDMKSPHWGQAFVDVDEDPKLVILTLNKAAPGMGRRMKKTLKGTGFSKVEIRLEDGSVAEKVGEDEDEAAEAPAAAAPAGAPADAAAQAPQADADPGAQVAAPEAPADAPAEDAAEPPAPASPVQAGPDAGALTKQLTDLVRQMLPVLAANPAQAGSLKELAGTAQGKLKSGDLQAAQSAIDDLKTAVDKAGQQPAAPAAPGQNGAAQNGAGQNGAAPPNMAALGKARLAWSATRKKVESDLDKLHDEMTKAYQDHGFGADLDKFFRAKVDPMMDSLDDTLVHKLDEVTSNTDPAQHAKLVREAKQIVQKYESYLSGEPLIAKLDANPFVPLQIEKTLQATLAALGKVIA